MLLSNFVAVPGDTHAIRRDSRGDAIGWDASGGRAAPEAGRAVRALVASALGLSLTFGTGLVEAEEASPPRVEDRSGMSPSTTVERAVDESERAAGAGEPRAAE